jgi:hypothetical protein
LVARRVQLADPWLVLHLGRGLSSSVCADTMLTGTFVARAAMGEKACKAVHLLVMAF